MQSAAQYTDRSVVEIESSWWPFWTSFRIVMFVREVQDTID